MIPQSVFLVGFNFIFLQGCGYVVQPCDKVVAKLFILHKLVCDNLDFSIWVSSD